jgi:hypothetical protein
MEGLEVAELISELGNSPHGLAPLLCTVPGGFELVTMASAISNMHCKIGAREDEFKGLWSQFLKKKNLGPSTDLAR